LIAAFARAEVERAIVVELDDGLRERRCTEHALAQLGELAIGARDLGEPDLVQRARIDLDADVKQDRGAIRAVAVGQRAQSLDVTARRRRQPIAQEVTHAHDRRQDLGLDDLAQLGMQLGLALGPRR